MFIFHLKHRHNIFKQFFFIIYFILFRWQQRIHLYIALIVLLITSYVSYRHPFGLLFQNSSIETVRSNLIKQQKQEQQIAVKWMENVLRNPQHYPNLISNKTLQSKFYDYLQPNDHPSSKSSYSLLNRPQQTSKMEQDHIIISILYSKQDSDHREGKFYIGQILYHLLKHHNSRFIITLCENNNTNEQVADDIELIRRLLPVFIVNSKSESHINAFEREKQAYLQCVLANFESFPKANYLLLLQDDAEPISKDFYNQLLSLIYGRIQTQWPLDGHRRQPAFIKIYHPRWLIGYSHPSFYIIVQLFATSLFLTMLLFACFYLYDLSTQVSQKPIFIKVFKSFISLRKYMWFINCNHNILLYYQ